MIAAMAVAAGAAFAETAPITSANVVGFQNQNWMPASYVMMGGQFENTDCGSIKLSQINFGADFQGAEYGDGPDDFTLTAPQIQLAFRDSEGILGYYFLCDGKVKNPDDPEESWEYIPGWVDENGNEADPDIELGLGFWFKDAFNAQREFNNAGQVFGDETWDKDFNKTFRMLVPPYPQATKLSSITFVDIEKDATEYGDGPDTFSLTATQIQIPFATTEGSLTYYFLADGKVKNPEDPEESWEYIPGWVDENGNEVDPEELVIPAGRGCWFRPCTNFKANTMKVIFSK